MSDQPIDERDVPIFTEVWEEWEARTGAFAKFVLDAPRSAPTREPLSDLYPDRISPDPDPATAETPQVAAPTTETLAADAWEET